MSGETQERELGMNEPDVTAAGEPSCLDSSGNALPQPAVCPHSFCVLCENRGAPGGFSSVRMLERVESKDRSW
jgi:hypothetical protein